MKIISRPLNKGEVFPCSFKKAKDIFKDTDIILSFSCHSRDFGTFANTPDRFYVDKNVRGKIIAASYMNPGIAKTMLKLYVLKNSEYPEEFRIQFEQECLPKFHKLYKSLVACKDDSSIIYFMFVEFVDKQLKIHQITYR